MLRNICIITDHSRAIIATAVFPKLAAETKKILSIDDLSMYFLKYLMKHYLIEV